MKQQEILKAVLLSVAIVVAGYCEEFGIDTPF